MLPNIGYAIWKTVLRNLNYDQCLNIGQCEGHGFGPVKYSPNEKDIMASMEYTLTVRAPVEKTLFFERLFFEVVIIIVKYKKIQHKRYNVNKNCFMPYMKRARIMLPVAFEEFEMAYLLFVLISFHYQLVKGQV